MKQGNSHKRNQRSHFRLEVVWGTCFAFLFTFSFIFAQAQASADSFALADRHFIVDQHHPVHIPFESCLILPEKESSGKREVDDSFDDDPSKLFATLSLRERIDFTSGECLLHQLLLSCENRTEVSLIILHHSWKSFLI